MHDQLTLLMLLDTAKIARLHAHTESVLVCACIGELLLFTMYFLIIVIGYVESEFQGEERGEDHSVLAGYISGLPDNRIITYAPISITASEPSKTVMYLRPYPPF